MLASLVPPRPLETCRLTLKENICNSSSPYIMLASSSSAPNLKFHLLPKIVRLLFTKVTQTGDIRSARFQEIRDPNLARIPGLLHESSLRLRNAFFAFAANVLGSCGGSRAIVWRSTGRRSFGLLCFSRRSVCTSHMYT